MRYVHYATVEAVEKLSAKMSAALLKGLNTDEHS